MNFLIYTKSLSNVYKFPKNNVLEMLEKCKIKVLLLKYYHMKLFIYLKCIVLEYSKNNALCN